MNRIKIFICDPTNKEQVEALETKVADLKNKYSRTKITWNQSSASASSEALSGYPSFTPQHVLSAAVEWDDYPSPPAEGSKGTTHVGAVRTGMGSARRYPDYT